MPIDIQDPSFTSKILEGRVYLTITVLANPPKYKKYNSLQAFRALVLCNKSVSIIFIEKQYHSDFTKKPNLYFSIGNTIVEYAINFINNGDVELTSILSFKFIL